MKNQILVLTALFIVAFFTACEQNAIIEPVEDIVQLETPTTPPQEALDELQMLIDSDFATPELESRCDNTSFPYPYARIIEQFSPVSCGVKLDIFGGTVEVFGGFQRPKGWFYYHVDELKLNGNYILIDSGMKYGSFAEWRGMQYTSAPYLSGCKYRAYLYLWDPGCNEWKRLEEKYYT